MDPCLTEFGELPEKALVWDVGGYLGDWSADMLKAYPTASIQIFEPVQEYYVQIEARGLRVNHYGISDSTKDLGITIAGDRSSTFEMGHAGTGKATIHLVDVKEVFAIAGHLDVLKLNVEGEEYAILDRLISTGQITHIRNLLVQFHTFVPNFGERYLAIKQSLSTTHALAWRNPFVWEMWSMK